MKFKSNTGTTVNIEAKNIKIHRNAFYATFTHNNQQLTIVANGIKKLYLKQNMKVTFTVIEDEKNIHANLLAEMKKISDVNSKRAIYTNEKEAEKEKRKNREIKEIKKAIENEKTESYSFDMSSGENPEEETIIKIRNKKNCNKKLVAKLTAKLIMKRAWQIRRDAAIECNCKVSEVSMSIAMKMAWNETK